jgi:hypothetical protein
MARTQGEVNVLKTTMAILGVLVMLLASSVPASAKDEYPCGDQYWHDGVDKLVQDCSMWRGAVPVFEDPWGEITGEPIGYLWNANGNWFDCHKQTVTYYDSGYFNDWWAYTMADNGEWGWVPEVYFSGGDDFERDGGLAHC